MPPIKLPRATLEQKIQILDYYHQLKRPQLETVDKFKNELSISTSSFSEWLKNEEDLRQRYNQAGTFLKSLKRKVKFKYEKINRAMDALVQRKLAEHEPINEPMLREYWSVYAHQYGVDDPKRLVGFSHGWLSQFKKRNGLDKKKMSGSHLPNSGTLGPNSTGANNEVGTSSTSNGANTSTTNNTNSTPPTNPGASGSGNLGAQTTAGTDDGVYDPNYDSKDSTDFGPGGVPNPQSRAPATSSTYDLMNPQTLRLQQQSLQVLAAQVGRTVVPPGPVQAQDTRIA